VRGRKFKNVKFVCDVKFLFFSSFNAFYHRCSLVILQLVNSFCEPHLLYAADCVYFRCSAVNTVQSA
jgi:hypothetical protein